MKQETCARIRENPQFEQLVRSRSRLSWTLSLIVLVLFFGLILTVAFNPQLMGQRLGGEASAFTLGVAVIFTLFVFFWVLTALYVRRANTEFDDLTRRILADATREA